MADHGNSSTCGPPCDILLERQQGVRWHKLAVYRALEEIGVAKTRGMTARKAAFRAVYNKWTPSRCTELFAKPEIHAAYLWHTRPETQAAVDLRESLVERLGYESLFDLTLCYEETQVNPGAVAELARMLFEGIRDETAPKCVVENMLDSGRSHSYGTQRRPPTFDEIVKQAGYLIAFRLKPFEELQRLGYSKFIDSVSHDRRGRVTCTLSRRWARTLLAEMEGWKDNRITPEVAAQIASAAILRLQEVTHDALAALAEDRDRAEGGRESSVAFGKKWAGKLAAAARGSDAAEALRWDAFALADTPTGSLKEIETIVVTWGKGEGA